MFNRGANPIKVFTTKGRELTRQVYNLFQDLLNNLFSKSKQIFTKKSDVAIWVSNLFGESFQKKKLEELRQGFYQVKARTDKLKPFPVEFFFWKHAYLMGAPFLTPSNNCYKLLVIVLYVFYNTSEGFYWIDLWDQSSKKLLSWTMSKTLPKGGQVWRNRDNFMSFTVWRKWAGKKRKEIKIKILTVICKI